MLKIVVALLILWLVYSIFMEAKKIKAIRKEQERKKALHIEEEALDLKEASDKLEQKLNKRKEK